MFNKQLVTELRYGFLLVVLKRASDSGSSWEMARNSRVMIAENYAPLRATLAQLLFSWGYEVETASDGLEALAKTPSFKPMTIIAGLQMPRMGGMELLKAVRHRVPQISLRKCLEHSQQQSAVGGVMGFMREVLSGEGRCTHGR